MEPSTPRRTPLFVDEPIAALRGLSALTDPDDDVAAVIDLAVMGARGDGKTQFLVHAIRALHGRAPALAGSEQELNLAMMRLVLDPRAPRPDATPPGVVPHFTFRVRAAALFERLGGLGSVRLACRLARVTGLVATSCALGVVALALALRGAFAPAVIAGAGAALLGAIVVLIARRRIETAGELEIVFWDVAGEQIYSPSAADYHALLGRLVAARRHRAEVLGRSYAFAPVLICNPLALGTFDEGSPYVRLRALLPMFAGIDRAASRALVAINRYSVVDRLCTRGAPRDEIVEVTARPRGEPATPAQQVARELVREHCLDAEDGRDGHVAIHYLRYDTAIRSTVEVDLEAATLAYEYDDGPGTFSGDAHRRFLEWVSALPRWAPRATPSVEAAVSRATPPAGDVPVGVGSARITSSGLAALRYAPRGSMPDGYAPGATRTGATPDGDVLAGDPRISDLPIGDAPAASASRSAAVPAVAAEVWARPPGAR
ncbi:MAG: hypothetical protein ABI467_13700 [Kofleriaceae bacterium]